MGIVGKYLDALSDEQRDRVIEAKSWTSCWVDDKDGDCRCLVGHAEDMGWVDEQQVQRDPVEGTRLVVTGLLPRHLHPVAYVGFKVPRMFARFGKDRIVRACKARAAKGNRVHEIREEIYKGMTVKSVMELARLVPAGRDLP